MGLFVEGANSGKSGALEDGEDATDEKDGTEQDRQRGEQPGDPTGL
jgi:hypothetical protein